MNRTEIIIQYAIRYGLPAARALIELFSIAEPTVADWEKLFAISEKSYEDYVKPRDNA